jgi:hypothetical protein
MIYDDPLFAGGGGSSYMREPDDVFEDEDIETSTPLADATAQREELRSRCSTANIDLEDVIIPGEPNTLKLGVRSGRRVRWIYLWSDEA